MFSYIFSFLIVFQLKQVFIHGRIFNGDIIYEDVFKNSPKGVPIKPDTLKPNAGIYNAKILFQEVDTINGGYKTIDSTTTDSLGRFSFGVSVGIKEKIEDKKSLEDLVLIGNYVINNEGSVKEVYIFDVSGRKIKSKVLRPNEKYVIGKIKDGVYFLKSGDEVMKFSYLGNKVLNYGKSERSSNVTLMPFFTYQTQYDTTYRFIIYDSQRKRGALVYPWVLNEGNIPDTELIRVTLFNRFRPIKWLLNPSDSTAYATDTVGTCSLWLMDVYYIGVGDGWIDYPRYWPQNPEFLYPFFLNGELTQPYVIYRRYTSPPTPNQWYSDSLAIARTFGVRLDTIDTGYPDNIHWYFFTGLPQVKKIKDTVIAPGGGNIPLRTSSVQLSTTMATIREDDPYEYTPQFPWTGRSHMFVTVIAPDILFQETKNNGESEIYTYKIYSDSTGSVWYDTQPLNWPSKVDAANKQLGELMRNCWGYGLNSKNFFIMGYMLRQEEIDAAINGVSEPWYMP